MGHLSTNLNMNDKLERHVASKKVNANPNKKKSIEKSERIKNQLRQTSNLPSANTANN